MARDIGDARPGRYGAAGGGVALAEVLIGRCWNVQGDAADAAFSAEVRTRFGLPLPDANTAAAAAEWTALWLGPKSWLLVGHDQTPVMSNDAFRAARDALNASGGALFDVSAGRLAFAVSGSLGATILAKACPVDLHDSAFPPGACAQSVFGQAIALLYRPGADAMFVVMAPRSLGRDVWRTLCVSAAPQGYEIGAAKTFVSLAASRRR